jgi:hypothetical protein
MNPELKHQLYGGDISDYYPEAQKVKQSNTPEQDNKSLSDIYKQILSKKNPLGLPNNIKNKITLI